MSVVKHIPLQKRGKKEQCAPAQAHPPWQVVKLCPRVMTPQTAYRRKGCRTEKIPQ